MKEKEKNSKIKSATEEEPIRNLFWLLLLIPFTPFLLLYYFATGKAQNSFILGSGLTIIMTGLSIYGLVKYSQGEEQKFVELNSMVEELSFEEQEELREEFSTLRKSVGADKIPSQLMPLLDVEQNMLTINYYNYLIRSGSIGKNGEGAILVLQNSLYAADRELAKAAWESLYNIGTVKAKYIMVMYSKDIENLENIEQQPVVKKVMPSGNTFDFYKQKFDNKIKILRNNF